jgi:HEAT repeat protein
MAADFRVDRRGMGNGSTIRTRREFMEEQPKDTTEKEIIDRQLAEYIDLLNSRYLVYRVKAAEALGDLGDIRAVPPLIEALHDPYVDVQWLAAQALGKIKDPRAVDPLILLLSAEDKWARLGAVIGLEGIGDRRAIVPIIKMLNDKDKRVRAESARALGMIDVEGLSLDSLNIALKDADAKVRNEVSSAIEQIKKKSAQYT